LPCPTAFEDHAGDTIQFGSKPSGKAKKQLRETMSEMIDDA